MPLPELIKRASSYFLGLEFDDNEEPPEYVNNEILFCKNNVCVHPPTVARHELDIIHHPGYLTVTTKVFTDQHNNAKRPTLFLNWIPNTTLKRCPSAVETSPSDEYGYGNKKTYPRDIPANKTDNKPNKKYANHENAFSDSSETTSLNSNSDKQSVKSSDTRCTQNDSTHKELTTSSKPTVKSIEGTKNAYYTSVDNDDKEHYEFNQHTRSQSMTSVNITIANPNIENVDLTPDSVSNSFMRSLSLSSCDEGNPNWMSTPEFLALKHNLVFPDSVQSSPVPQRREPLKCRRFSVDLSQMRSLRLFFNDDDCTCGQLVVASRESQYKILHFHHGGLDHLAQVLHRWHSLLHNIKLTPGSEEQNLPYRHFMVCRPEVQKSEQHPEEGKVPKITPELFYGKIMNAKGVIEDDLFLRKCIFFGGLDKELRREVWPFLLHCYPYNSTYDEREIILQIRTREYDEITKRRLERMTPEQHAVFWKNVQSVIEKDVVRTDRGNPFFAGDNNYNIEIMKNILLNYAVYNPVLGYTQGMSDLLAPVLCEIKCEAEAFWCFVGLMQRAIFVCTPTDNDMDNNLCYLRELIRIMLPNFYKHLEKHIDAMELLFCHRWILLCFKREFTEPVALRMWEACWSNYQTDYFHLFLCLAIVAVYAEDVIAQDLNTDEMLLHFSSLAMYMDGRMILRKARGLVYQFRQLVRIPCTLAGMCQRCGPGIWDSTHRPSVECTGAHDFCEYAVQ
ncbi:TBC1 domain family member 16 [Aricia agestis]|uniref:TBC1 domain family member 16 n=1 Tax=Aricia agestis TaxID=91739 RepID=UPI001C205805|nr:TBC1 domain family member 16 [Aricia agestis]XP_041978394.1 TBC1 domain family member 16 [Aricia agestis]XP_041978395.1 TBC1 domain family member 16 [Aricia agestis]